VRYFESVCGELDRRTGEGLLTPEDMGVMARLFEEVRPKSVVDIGTHKGKSARLWKLLGADEVTTIDTVAVDLNETGIAFVRGDSSKVPWERQVDMVWVDGDHEYGAVLRDLEKWNKWAKYMICGHDYGNREPGVIQAVGEIFGSRVKVNGVIWSFDKR
jgi:hypothetical protein